MTAIRRRQHRHATQRQVMPCLILGDCREELPKLPEGSIDTCITDPPYEIGFMGESWDRTGVAFRRQTWEAVYRVLKPGAFLLCFGGTRTFHRVTCAIEDAGFEIRDCILWLYGTGMPKSLDVARAGAGRAWAGWGTALKPAWEPIVVAMKPMDGTFAENAIGHGVAGLNVAGAKVGGRYPANLVLDTEAAELLDEQSGQLTSGTFSRRTCAASAFVSRPTEQDVRGHRGGDSGGASRFFYCAKAGKRDRGPGNTHPTVKPLKLMEYLCTLTRTPGGGTALDPFLGSGTTAVACERTGRTYVGIELSAEYLEIARRRLAAENPMLFQAEQV